MLVRLALVASAVLVVALLAVRLAGDRACAGAGRDAVALAAAPASGDPAEIARRARVRCTDVERLSVVGSGLYVLGHREIGEQLVRDAVRRAPESFVAWSTLARVEFDAGDDPRASMRRARALNPRWRGPTFLPGSGR